MAEIDELRREVAELRAELNRVDDWAAGVLVALQDALIPLLRSNPDMAAVLAKCWGPVSDRWDRVQADTGQAEDFHETADLLEPRKMLFRTLVALEVFPPPWNDS